MLTLPRFAVSMTARNFAATAAGMDKPSEKKTMALRPGNRLMLVAREIRPAASMCPFRSRIISSKTVSMFWASSRSSRSAMPELPGGIWARCKGGTKPDWPSGRPTDSALAVGDTSGLLSP